MFIDTKEAYDCINQCRALKIDRTRKLKKDRPRIDAVFADVWNWLGAFCNETAAEHFFIYGSDWARLIARTVRSQWLERYESELDLTDYQIMYEWVAFRKCDARKTLAGAVSIHSIYFLLHCESLSIKIGKTKNEMIDRFRNLGEGLKMLGGIRAGGMSEGEIHRRLDAYRLSLADIAERGLNPPIREWFDDCGAVRELLLKHRDIPGDL